MVDNPTGDDVYYEYGAPGAAYNAAGRVTKETAGTLIDQYRYGALGEVVKKTRTIEGKQYSITWKWDNFGRLRTIVYSNNVIIYYAYDTGGQVKQVFGYYNGTRMDYVNNVYYDEYGSRTTIAYANGVVSQYSYDVLMHRLISLKTTMGDSTYQNITYSYDKVGNIVTRTENGIVMSDNTVKNITHRYGYDSLYRLTQADGFIKENGNTVNSYTSTLQYSSIGTIVQKLQTVKIAGENDPSLTYSYNYSYAPTKPHAVAGINDNLTYRYDANGNMTAVYDTAKQFNRILYWDDDNRLTKTVDTTSGASVTTQYNYDAKGMRIIKDGPYGKSIYIDTGYVESSNSPGVNPMVASNHVFVGNTRVASVVKHTEEKQPATYFYASDHLGSSSVLTNNAGSYHERIEYLPYGETWVEDKATSDSYTTPYKFTGKELDTETGLYYFGARYYDARVSRWISADPALDEYIPYNNTKLKDLIAGGIYNPININLYTYAWNNPIKLQDYDGRFTKGKHEDITQETLKDFGFSKEAIEEVNKGNTDVDGDAYNEKTQYLHSMRGKKQIEENGKKKKVDETKEEAQKKAKDWIEKNINEAVESAIKGDYKDALYKFGQASHTAQDEIVHNWCTLEEHNAWKMDLAAGDNEKNIGIIITDILTQKLFNGIVNSMEKRGYTGEQIRTTIEGLKQYKPRQ